MGHKEFLGVEQKAMDAAVYVGSAKKMAAELESDEFRICGSLPYARETVARHAKVSESLLHSLRYRPPKTIAAHAYARLCAAIEAKAIRQIKRAFDEIAEARRRAPGVDERGLAEIEAALAKAKALLKAKEE